MLSNDSIENFIFCKYKYTLYIKKKLPKDKLAIHYKNQKRYLSNKYLKNLKLKGYSILNNPSGIIQKKINKYCISNYLLYKDNIQIRYDIIEYSEKEKNQIIPVFINPSIRVSTDYEKFCLTLSYLLSINTNFSIQKIRIISANGCKTRSIQNSHEIGKNIISNISQISQKKALKIIVKTKHCSICPNWNKCRSILISKDSISLLGNISSKELDKYYNKVIFKIR